MGRVSEVSAVVDEIRDCGQRLIGIADSLAGLFSGAGEPEVSATPVKQSEVTLEQVRAALAEKSAAGHTDEVRELIQKHGAVKLSEVDPGEYAALLADAIRVGLTEEPS